MPRAANSCSTAVRLPGALRALSELEPRLFPVQLPPVGACPTWRRPGHGSLRPARGGLPSLSMAASGAMEGLGPAQLPTTSPCWRAWPGTSLIWTSSRCPKSQPPEVHQVKAATARARTRSEFIYEAEGAGGRKRSVKRKHPFEGIIPNFDATARRTAAVREDLARYQAAKPCPDCEGTRLRREARHRAPTRDGRRPVHADPTPRCECLAVFNHADVAGRKGEIAAKVMREIRLRLTFLNDVGLNYLESWEQRRDAVAAAKRSDPPGLQIGSGLTGVMYVLDEPPSACTSATTTA